MSEYLRSNPLAEHNSGIALSSKDIPQNAASSGNMYQGQAGRAFVQGGGGMSQFHSFDGGNQDSAYARGSYAPVTVGYNSVTQCAGGGRGRSRSRSRSRDSKKHKRGGHERGRTRSRRCKKCGCDIVTGVGGKSRYRAKTLKRKMKQCRCHRSRHARSHQYGGNAAYSVAGSGTGVGPSTTALANPSPVTAYNSCATSPL